MILGYAPKKMHSIAINGEYGTDKFDSIMLEYDNGRTAHLITTIGSVINPEAVIYGTKGHIVLPNFSALQEYSVILDDGTKRTVEAPFAVNGFEYQIKEAENCLLANKLESTIMTHQHTLAVMRLMDKARSDLGLTFPWKIEHI
jgi:hypothetical protein